MENEFLYLEFLISQIDSNIQKTSKAITSFKKYFLQ